MVNNLQTRHYKRQRRILCKRNVRWTCMAETYHLYKILHFVQNDKWCLLYFFNNVLI